MTLSRADPGNDLRRRGVGCLNPPGGVGELFEVASRPAPRAAGPADPKTNGTGVPGGCRITGRRVVPVLALQCCFVSFAIEMHCGLPLPQHPFLHCAVPFWTTSIDQFVLASIRPARATISIGRRAPSAAPHWMRRAARLCVASLTLYFVRQRPDTKGAPPLYLTPLPNGSFPWCPPD